VVKSVVQVLRIRSAVWLTILICFNNLHKLRDR